MNKEYDELLKKFINLSPEEKVVEIIESLKQDIAIIQGLCKKYNLPDNILLNKEMSEINTDNVVDNYEAIFAYVKSFEDVLGNFLLYFSQSD